MARLLTPEERSAAHWAAIVALLDAQMGPTGQIPTVATVQPSVDLFTRETPAIGVQLTGVKYTLPFTKKQESRATFVVVVSVESQPNNAFGTPPNLADSNARLQAIIDDGQGHGVCPVLRDPANRTLGNIAALMLVTGVDYSWEIDRGAAGSQQVWSHALITIEVTDFIALN